MCPICHPRGRKQIGGSENRIPMRIFGSRREIVTTIIIKLST
jgi:hypothetical protein